MENLICNFCGNNRHKNFLDLGKSMLVECRDCSLVYLNPMPSKSSREKIYGSKYHTGRLSKTGFANESEIEQEVNKNIGRVREITENFGCKGRLLDIGSGSGFFIACLKRSGWDVVGLDVSKYAGKFAREKLGVNVIVGTLEQIRPNKKFDVITLYHILEHLPDPAGTLRVVFGLLNKKGVVIIKGPNLGSFDRLWHGSKWRGYSDRGHLFYFTPKTYSLMLEKAGFKVKKTTFQYWDPITHLLEVRLSAGSRADHPTGYVEKIYSRSFRHNRIFRLINKTAKFVAKLFNLTDRDLTMYATK